MKVLVAHNRYRSELPSGENAVVEDEVRLLRGAGVAVVELVRSSDEIDLDSAAGLLAAAGGPVYSIDGVRRFDRLMRQHRPGAVHLHNVFPLISPWVVRRAHAAGVPVVVTVHNFRMDCVNGYYFRDDRICRDCTGTRLALPAVRNGCYRGSRLQSLPMVAGRAVHASTWRLVDCFLALTDFHADYLRGLGVPAERITVRPTAAPDPGPLPPPGRDVLFVGRLDEGKGIVTLVKAWKARRGDDGRRLRVVGTGPLLPDLHAAVAGRGDVELVGSLRPADVSREIAGAAAVAVPSRLYEGFPRVVAEAFAHGRPVLAPAHAAARRS